MLAVETGICVGPTTKQLQSYARSREAAFLSALQAYGDQIGRGREKEGPLKGLFTGFELCDISSELWAEAIQLHFPEIRLFLAYSSVEIVSQSRTLFHVWDRFEIPEEDSLFLDSAYGQVTQTPNHITMDKAINERQYFGEKGSKPRLYPYSLSQRLEDEEHDYPEFVCALRESLR